MPPSSSFSLFSSLQAQGNQWLHFLRHTLHNIRKNKLSYFLGFSSCFIVVFVVALVVTILNNAPVVFLRLAELQVGEIDMQEYAAVWSGGYFLNYSAVEEILSKEKDLTYHSPRMQMTASVVPSVNCPNDLDPYDPYWKYYPVRPGQSCGVTCFSTLCRDTYNRARLYLVDSKREKHMNLGREWGKPPLMPGHIYIQNSLANKLGVQPGDLIYVRVSMIDSFMMVWMEAFTAGHYNWSSATQYFSSSPVFLPCILNDTFPDNNGKFGSKEQSAVIIEFAHFIDFLFPNLDPTLKQETKDFIGAINLYENAQSIVFNLPPPRVPTYINSNQDVITGKVVRWSSNILYRIGFNVVYSKLTVLSQLSDSDVISLFLGLILNIIIFILLFLSVILIYSLLMINVDTKTFEMGVMRMIGITRSGLIQLLLFQAFAYSIPSWSVGLIAAQIFGFFVADWFENITGVPISPILTRNAVLIATALGIFIPVVASIFPIRNALGKNLHDSLDTKRSKTAAVQVSIERAEDNSISFSVAIIGIALAAFGFGIYYIFPLSLLAMNFALLLNMFFFLLIGMLFGMVLLSLNLGHMLETLTVAIFFWWENKAVSQIILKNLVAHRVRNRKTAIMYALSLGFIIFINVTYQMQESSMTYQTQQENGAYIKVSGSSISGVERAQLERTVLASRTVDAFAFVTVPLTDGSVVQQQEIANIGHVYRDTTTVYGVSPNFFEVAIPGFLNIHEVAHDPDINLSAEDQLAYQLYSEEGSKSMIIGSRYETFLGLSIPKFSHFLLETLSDGKISRTRLKPMAFLDSAPLFTFSKFPSVSDQSALVSFTTYLRMSHYTSVDNIPMSEFLIKMHASASDYDKDTLLASLDAINAGTLEVFDYRKAESPLATASVVIQYFFQFTTVIAMLISFFSLMSSMFTNIHEQEKEIGILRAIGISKPALYRVYIYEAFVLVFSSSLLGILIGTVVGYTVLLQRILFTQLPIPFIFPSSLIFVVFFCSLLFAFLSAFGPIRSVLSNPVVNILRGT